MYLMWQMKCCVNDSVPLNVSQQTVSYKDPSLLLCNLLLHIQISKLSLLLYCTRFRVEQVNIINSISYLGPDLAM